MTDDSLIEHWVHPRIQDLAAYQVAEAQGLIKLDAMENPYIWDETLRAQWLKRLAAVLLNRYPDPEARALIEALRRRFAVPGAA
ncbi:MAG: hypothetical protein V1245_07435, partial [Arenicellales bacterium]|nr:hypothetical protein [Arenicellales bacterium]